MKRPAPTPLSKLETLRLRLAGAMVCAIASVVLAGWVSGRLGLISLIPGGTLMVMNSVVCAILSAASLFALAAGRRRLAFGCGAIVAFFAGAILINDYVSFWPGINNLLWRHQFAVPAGSAGRMAPNSASAFLVLGITLALLPIERAPSWWVSLAGGALIGFALFPLLNYVSGLFLPGSEIFRHMSVPTVLCLLVFASAIVWRPAAASEGDPLSLTLFASALGILFSIEVLSVQASLNATQANRLAARAYDARGAIDRFVSEIARMESTVRAYALTGQKNFRDRYDDHRADVLARLAELRSLAADDPEQLGRVEQLDRRAREKFAQSESILAARADHGAAAAAALSALSTAQTSALVAVAEQAQRAEDVRVVTLRANRTRSERSALRVQIIGTFLALGLMGFAMAMARRAAARRLAAERKLLGANAAMAASEERFRLAFEHAGNGMAIVGLDGRWLRVNQALCDIVGYTANELTRKTFQDITHPEDLAADLVLVQDLIADRRRYYQMEKRYLHRDGRAIWINLTVSLVRDSAGTPLHFVSQVEDVTESRKLQEELSFARDQAVAASRVKSEFLANMSHEIRTPMNAVIGMTDLLAGSGLPPDQREMIRAIQDGAASLLTIINDILDFSKIESGKFRLEHVRFDVRRLVRQTAAFLEPRVRQKPIEFSCRLGPDEPLELLGDPGRVRQVLTNLIGNAIKFTPRGQIEVFLAILGESPVKTRIRISIRDTGIGIPPEARDRLFKAFSQAESSTTRKYGGTGLGLAISRQLVELMGGEIGFESEPNRGATFWFEIEFDRALGGAAAPDGPAGAQASGAAARLRLLLVEDDSPNQEVARRFLAKLGHETEIAQNGEEALILLGARRYDAILMDCQMPVLDGFETTRQIRAGAVPGLDAAIPIVAFTASAMREELDKCRRVGMDSVVSKPVNAPALKAALDQAMGRRAGAFSEKLWP